MNNLSKETHKLFDPQKNLVDLRIVRWTTSGIVLAALGVGLIIFNYSNLNGDPTYDGFNNFLLVFRVPLSILALIIPIVALFAASHRSEQTKAQIKLANDQNNFSNYYKHLEEFEKYCSESQCKTKGRAKISSLRSFHAIAFPYARNGDHTVSNQYIDFLEDTISNFFKLAKGIGKLDTDFLTIPMDMLIQDFCSKSNIVEYSHTVLHKVESENGIYSVPKLSVMKFMKNIQQICTEVDIALSFDTSYSPSELVKRVISFNFDNPAWIVPCPDSDTRTDTEKMIDYILEASKSIDKTFD